MKKMVLAMCAIAFVSSCVFSINPDGNGKKIICRGEVQTRDLPLVGFDQIVANGSVDMEFTQGETFGVKVKANQEVFDYLDFRVEEGVLILETKDKVQLQAKEYDVYITAPLLKNVVVNGAADAEFGPYTSQESLLIAVNGAGDIDLKNVTVPELAVTINGAGDLDATGLNVGTLSVSVNGAGDVDLSGKAESASFSVSGAGDIDARNLDCPNIQKSKSGVASIRTK